MQGLPDCIAQTNEMGEALAEGGAIGSEGFAAGEYGNAFTHLYLVDVVILAYKEAPFR
jgi:hypothetical protein